VIFYILGLSGVGKSALCEEAGIQVSKACHKNLDMFIHPSLKDGNHWQEYFEESKRIIETLEEKYINHENIVLCDVGAGTMKVSEAFDYFQSKENVITIYDKPENIFKRVKQRPGGPWRNNNLEEYQKSEFTEGWKNLFDENKLNICMANLTEEKSKNKFVIFLKQHISNNNEK